MFPSNNHHIKDGVCLTRPPYRDGKKLRAVKVYTIAQESKYLLIQNIPSIAGVAEQLLPYFNQHGPIEQYWKLDGYERKDPIDDDQFFDTILIKYVQIQHARIAKCRLDDMNFMGSSLHVCYAPECENVDDLREKFNDRRVIVQRKSEMNHSVKGKNRSMHRTRPKSSKEQPSTLIPQSDTIPSNTIQSSSSRSFQQTTNKIRAQMREIVQKSNLIPLVLQQEMKFLILFLILLISPIELRRHDDDIYQLDDSLNDKYDRVRHRPKPPLRLDETDADDDQEYSPSFQHEKKYPSRKKVLDDNDYVHDESDDDDDKTTKSTSTSKSTDQNELSDTSTCINKYDIRPEQLVKVKELTNGAHMIRFVLIDKRTLPSDVKVKDSCMLDCCAERSCDLAMLSEKPTHEGFKCYLFACNGSCVLASHQDYTIMMPKKDSAMVKTDATSTSTVANNDLPHKGSFFRETSVIVFLIFGIVCTMILFVLLYCHCRDSQKRSRRLKNYHVDEDYLINGLYL